MHNYKEFVSKLVDGEAPVVETEELDAVLHWLVGRHTEAAKSVQIAFDELGVSAKAARRGTLRYLDTALFRDKPDYYALLGLSANCDDTEIRNRHKKLLQIFHPDRHTEDRDWFTERAERLNEAYAYLRKHHKRHQTESRTYTTPTPDLGKAGHGTRRPRSRWRTLTARKAKLRQRLYAYLGSSERVERRLYIILYSIPAALLAFVYFNQPDVSRERGRMEVVGRPQTHQHIDSRREAAIPYGAAHISQPLRVNVPSDSQRGTPLKAKADVTPDDGGEKLRDERSNESQEADVRHMSTLSKPSHLKEPTLSHDAYKVETLSSRSGEMYPALTEPQSADSLNRRAPSVNARNGSEANSGEVPAANPDVQESKEEPKVEQEAHGSWTYMPSSQGMEFGLGRRIADQLESRARNHKNPGSFLAVNAVLRQYEFAYRISNIEQLSRLFDQDAVTKYGKGRSQIRANYLALFHRTSKRQFVIQNAKVTYLGDHEFRVTAKYFRTWTLRNGESGVENGDLDMHLVTVGAEIKIRKLQY